ncbi:hypothetical protein EDC94DRAFT_608233 [Helicostylum pulchrum]|uniref:Uncharacterized protein n=1 Tax=Helicostylum pulchrum TaxID=562976 RepID=A0ABP9XWU0_9FUNG|nr:hypothetical protein EDC94DRAFT_608233 [Helicostylum pulchrum]
MLQRSTTVLIIVFMLVFSLMVQAAPTKRHSNSHIPRSITDTDKLQKRGDGLVHTTGWALLAINEGVKSTVSGIENPTVPGSKEEIEASAKSAGTQVGSAIGHAVKGGHLI